MSDIEKIIGGVGGTVVVITALLLIMQELSKQIKIPDFTYTFILLIFIAVFIGILKIWKNFFN